MDQQPRGKPPSQAPPPVGRGRNALTALGGGVLVLAVAGGAWVLFGRDTNKTAPTAIGPKVPSSAPGNPVFGPVVAAPTHKATVSPTSVGPVAATKAATTKPTTAPSKAAVKTTKPAVKPVAPKPVVTAPQQQGTVAKAAYTFKVARGDTLWDLTKKTLSRSGQSTSNANVAAHVAKLYASNADVIGSNPNLIVPGQLIVWPAGL